MGRSLGFLHNCKEGRQRLKNQIEGMSGVPVAKPIMEMSDEIHSIPMPMVNDELQLLANAIMRMPYNSSSGHGSKTALQYIARMTPEQLYAEISKVERCYSTKIRLDPGAKERFAFSRPIEVRLLDYMHTFHLYDYLKKQG